MTADRSTPARPAATPTPGAATSPLLDIEDLAVHFHGSRSLLAAVRRRPASVVRAVDGVDLSIGRGESVGLVGESGWGKSTLARALVGLSTPDAGHLRLDGEDLTSRRSMAQRRRLQMVFQDPYSSLNPRMTVGQTLGELLRVHDVVPRSAVRARTTELLDLVGLPAQSAERYPRNLSGGQRQRVGIARALALEPEVVVADEPVSALDVSVQASILTLLEDLRRELGLTLLFITHNLAVVRHVCDRVAVMYLGRIVEVADTESLFSDPQHPYTQALIRAAPRLRAARHEGAALRGELPGSIGIPSGCRFRTRCPHAEQVCAERDPVLRTGSSAPAHRAACHFAWGDAPGRDAPIVSPTGTPEGRP